MRKLIIIIIVLIANVANAQKDTIPDSESQPWYGTRHIVNMSGTDTMAFYQPGDTAHIVANDSIYVHKLLNHDINAGGDTPTLQEVTDAGNTTAENVTVNDLTANGILSVDGTGTSTFAGSVHINSSAFDHLKFIYDGYATEIKQRSSTGGLVFDFIDSTTTPYLELRNAGNGQIRLNTDGDSYIQGQLGIGTSSPSEKLDVNGNATAWNFILSSDRRLKSNIIPITDALTKALFLNPISFTYKDGRESIGFTAQNVQKIFPELVHKGSDGYLSLSYDQITAVNNAAIHELYSEIEKIKKENKRLKNEIQELKSKINEICKQLEE